METGGAEYVRGRQIEANVDVMVEIRYRSDITPDMRIVWGSRTLNITRAFDPDGRKTRTVMYCKEVRP